MFTLRNFTDELGKRFTGAVFAPPEDPDGGEDDEGQEGEEAGDAGSDDDEGGDEAQAGQEPEDAEGEEGQVARKPSRAERRVSTAVNEAKEAREEAARLRAEMEELKRSRQAAPQPQQESAEQEEARLALMTTEQRMDYKFEKQKKEHERQLGMIRFESADRADKAAYDAKAQVIPRYKKYAKDVEDLLLSERRQGRDFPRETILKFVLGQKVLENEGGVKEQRRQGQERIAAQRTNAPGGGRSDRASPRQRTGDGNSIADLEKRLDGVFI